MNIIYYRPIWTEGRYNEKHKVAIYYNLITGISYFFESYSAMVIGEILSQPKNGKLNIKTIANNLNIAIDNIKSFFEELEKLGLILTVIPSPEAITNYRKKVNVYNRSQSQSRAKQTTEQKLPYATSSAEQLYTEKVGGITSAMFELTYRCSEKCIHCYNEGATRNDTEICTRGNRKELTLEDYKLLIDELYEQGLIKVCLTGGDPFAKPIIWEIINYLFNKGIVFDIFTNGQSLINDVEKLANYYPRLVGISIYSGISQVHDYITRTKGSWQRSMEVIRQLSALAIPIQLKCCVMKPNVKSYYMVADIAKKYGAVPQFEISLTDSIEGDKCVSKYLRMTPEQLEIVLRDDNVPLYVGKEAPNYGGQKKLMSTSPCRAGENSICVTPEGYIIPCCAFHTVFGNLKDENIKDIIHKSKERKYWLNLTLNDYEECGRHDHCSFCNLCPGNNFIQHGTPIKASEVNCYMAKVRYNLAQKIKQGLDPLNGKSLRERLSDLPDYINENIQRELSHNYSDTRLKVGG